MKYARMPYSKVVFQEENALKRDCMTLNNNFCENDRFLAREKAIKTQRNFGFSDLEKISLTFLHEIFLKTNSFKKFQKLFPNKKTFFKRSKEKFSKRVSKIFQ